jgi:hypothetical protein
MDWKTGAGKCLTIKRAKTEFPAADAYFDLADAEPSLRAALHLTAGERDGSVVLCDLRHREKSGTLGRRLNPIPAAPSNEIGQATYSDC